MANHAKIGMLDDVAMDDHGTGEERPLADVDDAFVREEGVVVIPELKKASMRIFFVGREAAAR